VVYLNRPEIEMSYDSNVNMDTEILFELLIREESLLMESAWLPDSKNIKTISRLSLKF
jgi:hypothetical protein